MTDDSFYLYAVFATCGQIILYLMHYFDEKKPF